LRIAQVALRDSLVVDEITLADIELCREPAGACKAPGPLEARTAHTVYLRLKPDSPWPHGKFTGTVSLAVNERAELQAVNLPLHSSSWWMWLWGAVLIVAGTWLGWWINVWARNRVLRLEALKVVDASTKPIGTIRKVLEAAPPEYEPTALKRELAGIEKALTVPELDLADLLPPAVPSAFGGAGDRAARLQKHLEAQSAHIAGLAYIVREGMQGMWSVWRGGGQPAAGDALQSLDKRSVTVRTEADAQKVVQEVLTEFQKKVSGQGDVAQVPDVPEPGDRLTWEIGQIQARVWLVWGLLTVVSGAAILIVPNAGFGTVLDLLFCFFWGLGLPTAVDKLQQLNPSGITTSLGVSLPKTF
jgi:hypothetical protein